MREFNRYIFGIVAVMIFSCRQSLVDEMPHCDSASVSIDLDWSLSQMESVRVENLSIYAYPADGTSPYLTIAPNRNPIVLDLPVGSYDIILMNDAVVDIVGVSFSDVDTYDDFSAHAIVEDGAVLDHGQIAVARESVTITEEMVWCQYCEEEGFEGERLYLTMQPTPVTALCTIQLGVDNLDNAQSIKGRLIGMAEGAMIATNSRIESESEVNYYPAIFAEREYDDTPNSMNGVAQTQIVTFGKQPDATATYQLDIDIILNTGVLVSFTRDVTNQVAISDDFNIFIDLTDQESKITLPERSGMGFGVESWGDSEQVELK